MFRAYLVDDELPAVKRLTRLLQATGRVEIVGTEMNPAAAIEAIQAASPDVLFLDIQMPGLTGFDLLGRVERQPFVIFTTAYDQYALKAFEVNSIDYLLKPVEPEELDRALNKLEQFQGARGLVDLHGVLEALSRSAAVQRIPIRMGERTRFLDVGRITHFFTQGRLTFAAAEGKTYAGRLDDRRTGAEARAVAVLSHSSWDVSESRLAGGANSVVYRSHGGSTEG